MSSSTKEELTPAWVTYIHCDACGAEERTARNIGTDRHRGWWHIATLEHVRDVGVRELAALDLCPLCARKALGALGKEDWFVKARERSDGNLPPLEGGT